MATHPNLSTKYCCRWRCCFVHAGHVSTLLSARCPLQLADWANSYGPIYKLQLLNSACVVVTDPAAANELVRWGNSDSYIGKTRDLYRAIELGTQPRMPNILTSPDGAYWKAVRQATAPCFSISNLKQVSRVGGGYEVCFTDTAALHKCANSTV
jgi:cytochrome P450